MSKKTISEINKHNDELAVLSSADRINRARSVTVGTAFNGVTEVVVRGDGKYLFAILQPVEVIELIHQLAANVGCHINLQPRKDFASWRNWKYTEEELAQYNGIQRVPGSVHPPYASDISPHKEKGAVLTSPERELGLQSALTARSNGNEQTLATQKTVGRKRTKRAAAAA